MNNMSLYLLSFEIETQDELIDMLVEPLSYERYTSGENYGKHKPLITDANVAILNTYKDLCNSLKSKPSLQLLKEKFPTLNFDNIQPVKYEQLLEKIKLEIANLTKKDKSYQLMNLSNKVNNEGLTSEVMDELLNMSKVEVSDIEYKNIFDNLEEIYDNASLVSGIKTGIVQIDDRTGGLQPGTFNCLAGFAGAGKTTAAVNICYNAIKEGKNVCYITLEVPKVDMGYNFLSRHSFETKFKKPISHSDIKKKSLPKADKEYLFNDVIKDFNENLSNHLFILDETDFNSYTFRAFETKIKECDAVSFEKNGSGIDLLVIDQAQLLKFGGGISSAGSETSVINLYVSFFRQQAINFIHSKRPCTVLMLSQINRDGFNYASKHEGRYTLTNLAEANELERASAMVIALFTDESLKASKQVSIQLLKSRNGETIQDPVLSFMDPVYYVFGSEVTQGNTVFDGATTSLFGDFGETLDLSSMSLDFDNIESGL